MQNSNNPQREMAILEAAMPYVSSQNRRAIELVLQANSLINLAKGVSEPGDSSLEIASINSPRDPQTNIRDFLTNIQEFLTPKENDMVQTILNFMSASVLFKNYQEFAKNNPGNDDKNTIRDFLLSKLSPDQKSIFEQLQNIVYNK